MTSRNFSLQPFSPGLSDLEITGTIARQTHRLAVRYVLHGPLENLVIPAPAGMPARRHGLWEATCFEFFFGVKDTPGYWEFNLSPAGHWNVYRFSDYRQGMVEEIAFRSLPLSVSCRPDSLLVALDVEIDRIVAADQPLAVGLAAVLKLRDQEVTYWALAHPGPQADFHRRDSFLVEL
jgi:hypothetical protein